MRIGCLQFAPQVGDVDANLNRAEAVLDQHEDLDLDLLILPELAFSGYNFRSLRDIAPFLEPTAAGVSSSWARATALKYDCNVIVGYPETADVSHKWPSDPEYYNSALVVNQDGDTWGHYRKTHLYYTDETWALEGSGFFKEHLPGIGKVAMGICMDLNPYKFEAPWTDYEFAVHARNIAANVVVLSMAWLTREPADAFCSQPKEPDMETLTYWIKRLEPLIRADDDDEVIVIFANRCGTEDDAVYAGTSAVIGIQSGEVTVYGLLGRAEEKLLIVDTKGPGFAKLVYRPEHSEQDESSEVSDGQFEQPDADNASHDTLTRTYEHPSNTNDGLNATGLAGHRTHGHVFLGIDPSSPMSTNFSQSVFSDSPLSPRYFWDQSSRIGAPVPTQFPPRNMRGQHQDGRASVVSRSTVFSQDGTQRHSVMSDARTDPQTEFSRLMGRLRGNPTPRNGSADKATGFRAQQKEPSQQQVFPHVQDYKRKQSSPRREPAPSQQETKTPKSNIVQVSKQGPLHGRPSQVPSRDETPVAARSRNDTKSSSQERMGSPELDRLGVDLIAMRLAAETQNKRDSLLCHVDEDDFIILQTLRRDSPTLETSEIEDKPHKNTLRSRHLASKTHGDERQHTTTPQHDTLHSDRYNTPDRVDRVETYRREPAMSPPSKTLSNFVAREVAHRHSNSDLQASAKSSRSRLKEGPTERSGSASQLTREKRHAETPVANQHDAVRSSTLRDGHRQAPVLRSHADTPSRSKSRDKAGTKAPLSISIAPPVPSSESPKSGMRAGQRREKKNDSTTRAADMPPTPKAMVLPPSVDFAVYEKKQGKTSKGSPPPRAGIIDPEPRKALADSAIGVFDMGSAAAKVARPRSAVW